MTYEVPIDDFPFDFVCDEKGISIEKLVPKVVWYLYNDGWENDKDLVIFRQVMKVYLMLGITRETIKDNHVNIYKDKSEALIVEWNEVLGGYDYLTFDYWGNQLGTN